MNYCCIKNQNFKGTIISRVSKVDHPTNDDILSTMYL